VQYAHARTYSVFRNAQRDLPELDTSVEALRSADLTRLSTPEEIEIIRTLGSWPRQVAAAARAHEPHRLAFYLHELAAQFHAFWGKGKEDPSLRFVNDEDAKLTLARLALVDGVRRVLSNGLELLGVSAPQELS
jgi:arginyl-tRNA synthetase